MRSAKEAGCFPYSSSVVCYFEVFSDGSVKQLTNKNEKLNAYVNANSGKSTIYAVWPGKWRSDLFVIDDLEAYHEEQDLLGLKPRRSSYVGVAK